MTSADRLDSLAYTLGRYREVSPQIAFQATGPAEVDAWAARARKRLLELIGPWPDKKVALNPSFGEPVKRPGHTRRSVTFQTRADMAAFGYLLMPEAPRRPAPAFVCIPGHGRGVDEIVGIDEKGRDRDDLDGYQHDFAVQCARRGYVTLALEPLGFGHRRDPDARKKGAGASSCQPAAGAALLLGESMVGWRTWDALRAVDLLAGMPEVDPQRIGMMGISGGGTITLYAAALDTRIRAAFLSCSFCTYRDSIYSVAHCIDNYVPGILKWFEMADVAALIAPRFLFVESGTRDTIFPEAGVRAALRQVARAYEVRGAPDHLGHDLFDAGHQFDGAAAFLKLGEWLA